MKKLLLSFAAALACFGANADVVAFVADGATYTGDGEVVTIKNNATSNNSNAGDIVGKNFTNGAVSIELTRNNSSYSFVTGNLLRWYQGDTFTFTPTDCVITKVVVVNSTTSYAKASLTIAGATPTTYETDNLQNIWEGEAAQAFTFTTGAQKRISYIEVTYEPAEAAAVEAPVFKLVEGQWGYSVEITTATEGATIYYTTDGTEPTASSSIYRYAVEVWEETTFKAVAIKDGEESRVVTYTVNPPYLLDGFGALLDFQPEAGASIPVVVNASMTAIYQSGSYLWLSDGYNNMLVYGNVGATYNNGDRFSRLEGNFTLYNTLPEITSPSLTAAGQGTAVAPTEIYLDQVAENMLLQYVKLTGVNITDVDGRSATLSDGETQAPLYNSYNIEGLADGEDFTVEGFITINYGKVQLTPTAIYGGQVIETVATPEFDPASGEYEEGTEIAISCATEGAVIYYTTDGTEPTAESAVYTEPLVLSEAFTLKAIAVAEDMLASEVATATYTVYDPEAPVPTEAAFDFTTFSGIAFEPAVEIPTTASTSADLDGVTMSVNGINIAFAKNDAGTEPRIWRTASATSLRIYKKNTITVTCSDKQTISEITFTPTSASGNWGIELAEGQSGTFADKVWSAPVAVARETSERVGEVVFTVPDGGTNTYLNGIDVKVAPYVGGVADVVAEDVPAVYYNLQGVRVAQPTQGLYIVVRGNKVAKEIVK